ncbi:MAG TPA: c-type cytochrome [Acidimicrobiales bacterium]|nr:c-type cytochrome [Acidimicrobiales bacterium]
MSPMRPRRKLIAPLLLVSGVAVATIALFGGGAGAQTGASPTSSSTSSTTQPSTTTTVTTIGGSTTTSEPTTSTTTYSPYGGSAPSETQTTYPPQTYSGGGSTVALVKGREMFVQSCAACHGLSAEGSIRAPTLAGLGAGTVDFWVSTGRMPLATPTVQPARKKPVFDQTEAREIADYVASLAPGGVPIPKVDLSHADLQRGGSLFRLNCATCHSYLAVGGALDYGANAPPLSMSTPTQIAEAIRTGPANMPRFGPKNISDQDMNDIIKYVKYITKPNDRGGFDLGHLGPVAEGLIGIVFGVGLLMLAAYWIGDRA